MVVFRFLSCKGKSNLKDVSLALYGFLCKTFYKIGDKNIQHMGDKNLFMSANSTTMHMRLTHQDRNVCLIY